jgi:uncharacterized iron-regulated membrane protein
MRYIRTVRNVHLWVGVILSFFILIESATGLIQAEPWIIGADESQIHDNLNSFAHFTNSVHEGKIGTVDLRWIIDITAIGLIILTLTGFYLSVPFLHSRRKH